MKFRHEELYHKLSLDDTGTKIIDLNFTDPIIGITLMLYGTNGATSNKGNWMSDVVTKIEVMDRSEILKSISLKEAQILHLQHIGRLPYITFEESASGTVTDCVTLFFGRDFWDREYYLDPTKHLNPQLKITTDEDVIRAMGADGFLSESFRVSIVVHLLEEGAEAAKGFFKTEEIYDFTSGTSGEKRIDLPTDYPYAHLTLHSTIKGSDIRELISQLKLSCDAGKFTAFDRYTHDLMYDESSRLSRLHMRAYLFRKHNETVYSPLYECPTMLLLGRQLGHIPNSPFAWSGQHTLYLYDYNAGTVDTEETLPAEFSGDSLHCSVTVPFGKFDNPATYFPAPGFGSVKLIMTQAAAGAVKVIVNQVRAYA